MVNPDKAGVIILGRTEPSAKASKKVLKLTTKAWRPGKFNER